MKKLCKLIVPFIPPLVWMLVIFLFSATPAVQSTQESTGLAGMIVDMAGWFVPIDPARKLYWIAFLEPHLRKAAHMTEFAVLFLLWMRALNKASADQIRSVFIAAGVCILYAASDEFHQLFVPGRSGMLTDVCIDAFGVLIAAFFYLLVRIIKERNRQKT